MRKPHDPATSSHHCISVSEATGDLLIKAGTRTGVTMGEIVELSCAKEILAGARILEERKRR